MLVEDRPRVGMDDHGHTERGGDRIHRDVVMRWADPAGGEQIIVCGAEQVHRLADAGEVVGDDPHLGQADALIVQPGRHLRDILVLRAAGKDLVADHD